MVFVVDKVAPGQFSPGSSVSPANFHSTDCSIFIIYHPGAGIVGQLLADVQSGLRVASPQEAKKKKLKTGLCDTVISYRKYQLLYEFQVYGHWIFFFAHSITAFKLHSISLLQLHQDFSICLTSLRQAYQL
jgi:hypothetical protein